MSEEAAKRLNLEIGNLKPFFPLTFTGEIHSDFKQTDVYNHLQLMR